MIRKFVALAAGCAVACLASAALAATQLAAGSLSASAPQSAFFPVAAGTLKVQIKGATSNSQVELIRSLDGGVTGAPIAIASTTPLSPSIFTGDISFDVSEQTAGAMYAFVLLNPVPNVTPGYQAWQ